MKRFWRPSARCHFEGKHASFHSRSLGIWSCSWCAKMLESFKIIAREPDGTAFWAYDKAGKMWKLFGTESWKAGAWNTTQPLAGEIKR